MTAVTMNPLGNFGQTLLKHLWPLLLFSALCPGRDTQDDGLTYHIGNGCGPQHMSFLFNLLSSIWSVFATNTIMVLGLVYAAFYHSIIKAKMQAFERKHSQWRLSKILPMFLMVPLCINVTLAQSSQSSSAHSLLMQSKSTSCLLHTFGLSV